MWVIHITVPYNKDALFSQIAKKNNITLLGYPNSHTIYPDHVRIMISGYCIGSPENVKNALKDLKKSDRVINIERQTDDFLILDVKQHISNKFLFQPGLLFVKPGITNNKGEYLFEIASFDREKLTKIHKEYKFLNAKLDWIKKKKITNIQASNIYPNLTDKQKKAFKLAVERGYYGYPRKTDLIKLAKEFGSSYSTFQFHLRNAEKKLMPSLL